MIELSAEQRQLAKIVHDYASQFPLTEDGDAQLLQACLWVADMLVALTLAAKPRQTED